MSNDEMVRAWGKKETGKTSFLIQLSYNVGPFDGKGASRYYKKNAEALSIRRNSA